MPSFYALIPAAGSGSRMGDEVPKQYLPLAGKPMIRYTLTALCSSPRLTGVFVVLAAGDKEWPRHDWSQFSGKLIVLECGGATGADVKRTMAAVQADVKAKFAVDLTPEPIFL